MADREPQAEYLATSLHNVVKELGSITALHTDEKLIDLVGEVLCRKLAEEQDDGLLLLDMIISRAQGRVRPRGNFAVVYIDRYPEQSVETAEGLYCADFCTPDAAPLSLECFDTPEEAGSRIADFLRKKASI